MTFEEAFALYIEKRGSKLTQKTKAGYQSTVKTHATALLNKELSTISRDEALAIYESVRANSVSAGKKFIQVCGAVVEFYNAWSDDTPIRNVFSALRKLKLVEQVPRRTVHLTEATLPLFFSSLSAIPRDKQVLLLLLLYTGCRRCEIGDLLWSECDLSNGVLIIPGERRKNHKTHRVVLSEIPLKMLRQYWKESGSPTGPQRCFYKKATTGYREVRTISGLDISNHDCRRTFVSVCGGLGIPDIVTKKLAGHALGDITASYMTILDNDAREYNRRIVERMHVLAGVSIDPRAEKPKLKMSLDHAKTAAIMTVSLDKWSTQNASIL